MAASRQGMQKRLGRTRLLDAPLPRPSRAGPSPCLLVAIGFITCLCLVGVWASKFLTLEFDFRVSYKPQDMDSGIFAGFLGGQSDGSAAGTGRGQDNPGAAWTSATAAPRGQGKAPEIVARPKGVSMGSLPLPVPLKQGASGVEPGPARGSAMDLVRSRFVLPTTVGAGKDLAHKTDSKVMPRRFPLARPNGVQGYPPFPLPDNVREILDLVAHPGVKITSWHPHVYHEAAIPYVEGGDYDAYLGWLFGALHLPHERVPPNPPADELYKHVDFSLTDPVIEATRSLPSFVHVPGSFDWCKDKGRRCSNCTIATTRPPGSELCSPCTHCSAELEWVDKFTRGNPTFYAKIPGTEEQVVMKFICILGSERGDPHNVCKKSKGQPPEMLQKSVQQIQAITAVKAQCGNFGNIAVPYWVAHVKTTTPEGDQMVDQIGIIIKRSHGESLEFAYTPARAKELRQKILNIPSELVLLSALHDFVMCEADRHYGNVYLDMATNKITLIDNDMELGHRSSLGTPNFISHEYDCWANSIFLPGNLESYRIRNSPVMAYSMDYRCHVNDTKDIPLPKPVRQCLEYFASKNPNDLNSEYGFMHQEIGISLNRRAVNILTHGFEKAVAMEGRTMYRFFQKFNITMRGKEDDKSVWFHRRFSMWRPWVDPFCPESVTDVPPRWPRWARPWRDWPYGPEQLDKWAA